MESRGHSNCDQNMSAVIEKTRQEPFDPIIGIERPSQARREKREARLRMQLIHYELVHRCCFVCAKTSGLRQSRYHDHEVCTAATVSACFTEMTKWNALTTHNATS